MPAVTAVTLTHFVPDVVVSCREQPSREVTFGRMPD